MHGSGKSEAAPETARLRHAPATGLGHVITCLKFETLLSQLHGNGPAALL
jgi:hypothetical protein